MVQKKVCMLGAFAVGKTSLVARFVRSIFSDKYHTTVGVKIDKKTVVVEDRELNFILWDIHGEDEFQGLRTSYLRGSAGYLLVVDGTRPATLDAALTLNQIAQQTIGKVPFVWVLNKADLENDWEITGNRLDELSQGDSSIIVTSAKTGSGVEEAFLTLARQFVEL